MPREKTLHKFHGKELFCGNYVRSDKWMEHCRKNHSSKFKRGIDIQYDVWATKNENCDWKRCDRPTAKPTVKSESESTTVSYSSTGASSSIGLPADSSYTIGAADATVVDEDSHDYPSDAGTQIENMLAVSLDGSKSHETTELSGLADEVVNSINSQLTGIANTNADAHSCSSSESEDEVNLAPDDPAGYAGLRIDSLIITSLLNKPVHPPESFIFPTKNGRQCSRKWFSRILPDQTTQPRKWLSYSISADKLYCIHCMLFGGPLAADSVVWVKNGYNNWSKLSRDIPNHEESSVHKTSESSRLGWLHGNRIDSGPSITTKMALVESRRRAVAVEIKAIQWLSREMVALRGHESVGGKFLSLYRLLAEYDASAKAYLDHLDNMRQNPVRRKPAVNILSPRNVRRILNVMKTKTLQRIVERMKQSGVCSIINDGTQDLSKLEASCLLIRYIERDGSCRERPVERVVGIFMTGSTSGQTLCDKVVSHLAEVNIAVSHIIGQSYDGAGNMSGKYKGLQSLIKQLQPKARYVWCSAHRLNLVVESVVGCCPAMRNTIGILQELYNFFGSHRRHEILINLQKDQRYKKTLKRVSNTTRTWRSVEDSCITVVECYSTILTALNNLAQMCDDPSTVSTARGLALRLKDFEVILSIHLLNMIFAVTGPPSRILQSIASDMSITTHLITECIERLEAIRSDVNTCYTSDPAIPSSDPAIPFSIGSDGKSTQRPVTEQVSSSSIVAAAAAGDAPESAKKVTEWDKLLNKAQSFASDYGIATELPSKRPRKTPRRPGEQATDDRPTDPVLLFKAEVYYYCLDKVISQLKDRFTDNALSVFKQMCHFTHSKLLTEGGTVTEEVTELCATYGLDAICVVRELNEFRHAYRSAHYMINMDDLLEKQRGKCQPQARNAQNVNILQQDAESNTDEDEASELDSEVEESENHRSQEEISSRNIKWVDHSFMKPLRFLSEMSSYPHLQSIYRILASLAVTSSSAERTLSRVRIVKNRLRTSMADDWFSSLTILAAESDVACTLTIDEIINSFAQCSPRLSQHLL